MIELGIQLDTLLDQPPSRAAWRAITALFDRCADSALPDLLARAEPRLAAWPDRLRALPRAWWKRLVAGKSEPRAAIARVRTLWGYDDESDDDEFSVFTYAVQVDISPDLGTFALADAAEWHHNGGDIGLWDNAKNRLRALLLSGSDYHGEPYALGYSPDGQWIAAAPVEAMFEGEIRVWDAATGELRWEQPFGNPKPGGGDEDDGAGDSETIWLDWSADSRLLAATSARFGGIEWWSARSGEALGRLPETRGATALRFAPDGATIAVAIGNRIRIWSLAERRVIAEAKAGKDDVWGLCFSADGATLAAVSRRAITLFAVERGALIRQSRERLRLRAEGAFEGVSMTPLASGGIRIATIVRGGVELRDRPGEGARKIEIPKSARESIRLSRDGRNLITAGTSKVQLFWL